MNLSQDIREFMLEKKVIDEIMAKFRLSREDAYTVYRYPDVKISRGRITSSEPY